MVNNDNKSTIVYKLGGMKKPSNTFKQRLLLKMYNAPILNKIKCIKRALYKEFNLPMTTSIGKGFYCSAPYTSDRRKCRIRQYKNYSLCTDYNR